MLDVALSTFSARESQQTHTLRTVRREEGNVHNAKDQQQLCYMLPWLWCQSSYVTNGHLALAALSSRATLRHHFCGLSSTLGLGSLLRLLVSLGLLHSLLHLTAHQKQCLHHPVVHTLLSGIPLPMHMLLEC